MHSATWRYGLVLALVLAGAPGCAMHYVDSQGQSHFFGLMALTLPPAAPARDADAVRVRSLGLSLTSTAVDSLALTLGYQDLTFAALHHDSVITRAALLRATHHEAQQEERP